MPRPPVTPDRPSPRVRPAALAALCALVSLSVLAVLPGSAVAQPVGGASASPGAAPAPGSNPEPARAMPAREGAPVAEVRVLGLVETSAGLVRSQLRTQAGRPFREDVMRQDLRRLELLGRFGAITVDAELDAAGRVVVTFRVDEQPALADVLVAGNKAVSDDDLLDAALLRPGDPIDDFLIDRGARAMRRVYQDEGFFVVDVAHDAALLREQGVLLYRVVEGPRTAIADIRFEGNAQLPDNQLSAQVRSRSRSILWGLIDPGTLDQDQLDRDAAAIRREYRERGYLDAQVGRRIDLAPDQRRAVVTFLISEGRPYRLGRVRIDGATVFPEQQIRLQLTLTPGAVYRASEMRNSVENIRAMYGRLGYVDIRVGEQRIFDGDKPVVDLVLRVQEGVPQRVGRVIIRGNDLTQTKVVLRELRGLDPGRPIDLVGLEDTRRRLANSRVFRRGTVTLLGDPTDEIRDVLVEVEEARTGRLQFGVGVSSDVGLLGNIQIRQNNFDLFDPPESFGELAANRAFRGAGQRFDLTLQPGIESQRYSVRWREPAFLESDYFFDLRGTFFERERLDFDERRLIGDVSFGRNFGDVWSGFLRSRFEDVDIRDVEPDAPTEVFALEGSNSVRSLTVGLSRNTIDSLSQPGRGSDLNLAVEQVGVLGGDFDFTRITAGYTKFWTVDEDFLGRKTTLRFNSEVGYIPQENESPFFERFFRGGRSFRGFDERGVGPRGVQADDGSESEEAVGDDWMLLAGLQYEFPLYEESLRGVLFTDQGTITSDPGFENWRATVGFGFRVVLPIFQAPLALDFAFPIAAEDEDVQQVVSFTIDVPFR
ncbi:MAG: outer membrane protein assembly factor BamA [Planctomycetota bacterium]